MREYGFNLFLVIQEEAEVSPKYVLNLIEHLPTGCDTVAMLRGGEEFRGWDLSQYSMIGLTEAVRALTWVTVAANSKSKPKPLEPIKLPGTSKKHVSNGMFAQMANRQIAVAKRRKGE